MKAKAFATFVLCGLFLTPMVLGQPPKPPERVGGPHRLGPFAEQLLGEDWEQRDVQQLMELVMMVRLSKELELSEEHTVVMVRRFQELKERLGELNKERQDALKALKESVKAEEGDEAVKGKLDALMALDRELLTMKQRAFEKVSNELSPVQQAKLYVFLQDFEHQMRRLVERARQQRGGFGMAPGQGEMPHGPGRFGPHGGPGRREEHAAPSRGRRGGPGRGPGEFEPEATRPGNPPEPPL